MGLSENRVGLSKQEDRRDPDQIPEGDPLHPEDPLLPPNLARPRSPWKPKVSQG